MISLLKICCLIWERVFGILRCQNYFDYDRFFTHVISKIPFFLISIGAVGLFDQIEVLKENWKKL
jgi:hypothetical protein